MKKTLLLLFVLALASCRTVNPLPPDGAWRLSTIILDNGVVISPQSDITMSFRSGDLRVAGKALCNSYGARYSYTENIISFSEIVMTDALCNDSLSEGNFFLGLQRAQSFVRSDTTLTIRCYDSVAEMNFIPLDGPR